MFSHILAFFLWCLFFIFFSWKFHENIFKKRYSDICDKLNLVYYSLDADPIKADKIDKNSEKYKFISSNVINKSNYYKNLLVKKNEFKKLIDQF